MDRGRAVYPVVLIVVAAYYVLFGVMGASGKTIEAETVVALGFTLVAVVGFRRNMWLVAAGIAGHGVFDFSHYLFIQNPGVPVWWPGFCAVVDIMLGGWLGVRLLKMDGAQLIDWR